MRFEQAKEDRGMAEVEMTIDSIRMSLMNYQRVVILKEKYAERYLPIWIGPAESEAIAVGLQEASVPRPLTHDLLNSVISQLGARVDRIVVNDLKNDTFYAKLIVDVNQSKMEIDSRPSDALALAVRSKVAIFADESVLDKAGILLDKETGKPIVSDSTTPSQKVSDEEAKKSMSAFYDFINTLNLDDFDKRKS